jgi:hypothetical protein
LRHPLRGGKLHGRFAARHRHPRRVAVQHWRSVLADRSAAVAVAPVGWPRPRPPASWEVAPARFIGRAADRFWATALEANPRPAFRAMFVRRTTKRPAARSLRASLPTGTLTTRLSHGHRRIPQHAGQDKPGNGQRSPPVSQEHATLRGLKSERPQFSPSGWPARIYPPSMNPSSIATAFARD